MKKLIYILIFGLVSLSCNESSKEKNPPISETKTDTQSKLVMINSGSLVPSKDIILNGINFSIVENEKGDTTFWSTRDINFKTPEGYGVGNQLKDISQIEKDGIYKEPGYGYLIKLSSDWQLGFCEGNSCTDNIPTDTSVVKWIQKKK